jgi:limonene-1,2-epoxide hydrolase
MSATHSELVREFCLSLTSGDMRNARRYLADNVHYHNQPWSPLTGADAVCEFLQPFVDGTHCRLARIGHRAPGRRGRHGDERP